MTEYDVDAYFRPSQGGREEGGDFDEILVKNK